MHTNNRMQTYWTASQNFIKENWPKITDIELAHINGDYDKFATFLNDIYNNFPLGEALARDKLRKFYDELDEKRFA